MAQKLPADGFEWDKNNSKFNKNFIKKYDKDSKNGYILEVDVEYPKGFHSLQSNLRFPPERMRSNKCNKFVCNLYDKKAYSQKSHSHKSFIIYNKSWTSF